MPRLNIETAVFRIAVFPTGNRLLTVNAVCVGSEGACARARLVPRRHAEAPADGLWDIDLVCERDEADAATPSWRELAFTGEADWCRGVRLHSPGGVLEQRLVSGETVAAVGRAPSLTGTSASAVRPLPGPGVRVQRDAGRFLLDVAAGALFALGLAALPLTLPAQAAQAAQPLAAVASR